HADLKNHRKGGDEGLVFKDVHTFNADHPEFRLKRDQAEDTAQVRFNHQFHLVKLKEQAGQFKVLARQLAKLDKQGCVHCNEPDPAGRYMKPINYENHCKECHPLSVQLAAKFRGENAKEDEEIKKAVLAFNRQRAPHKEPHLIRAELRQRLLEFVFRYPIVPDEAAGDDRLVDEGVFGKRPNREQWKWVKKNLASSGGGLFAEEKLEAIGKQWEHTCTRCHYERRGERRMDGLPVFEKTKNPTRWFTHARFSHQHHRMLDCTECH